MVRGMLRVRLGIGLGLGSGRLFSGWFFPRNISLYCIQFLKWNALSLYFYSKNSFSKNIYYVIHLIFKKGINNIFPSQKSFLLLSSNTRASFANKPIKFCRRKPNTWRHIFVVVVYVLLSWFSYTTAFFCCRSFLQIQRAVEPDSFSMSSHIFQTVNLLWEVSLRADHTIDMCSQQPHSL